MVERLPPKLVSGFIEPLQFLLDLCEEVSLHSRAYAIYLRMEVELKFIYRGNMEAYLRDRSLQIKSDFQYLDKVGALKEIMYAWSFSYNNREKLSDVFNRIMPGEIVVHDHNQVVVADALEASLFDIYISFDHDGYWNPSLFSLSTIFKSHVFSYLHPKVFYFDMQRKGKLGAIIPKWQWVIADLILQKETYLYNGLKR